jgi:hypothetical protein
VIIKTLKIENARLNEVSGDRIPLADFIGSIDISEERTYVPILGQRCKSEKRILASMILCEEIRYLSQESFSEGKNYEVIGDVTGAREQKRLLFSGLRFYDDDPTKNTVTFEITDLSLIEKLLKM